MRLLRTPPYCRTIAPFLVRYLETAFGATPSKLPPTGLRDRVGRHIRESDDVGQPYGPLTKEETQKVRLAAKSLLHRLREEQHKVLIQNWFKDGQGRARVRSAVEAVLDNQLPDTYDRAVFTEKCSSVFETMVSYACQGVKWAVAA